jgi:hypothetical protein
MQRDLLGLAAQVLLAQGWSGVGNVTVGAENPHWRTGIVVAEGFGRRNSGRSAAYDDQSRFGHHQVIPALAVLNPSNCTW